MEPNNQYSVVYQGQLKENLSQEQVTQNLINSFKLDEAKAKQLIARSEYTIKRELTKEKAQALLAKVTQVGLVCSIDPPIDAEPLMELELEPLSKDTTGSETDANIAAKNSEDSRAEYTYDYEQEQAKKVSENPYQTPESLKAEEGRRFCRACGKNIHPTANICPFCQSSQLDGKPKSKVVAAILGITLGIIGVHRFYLGKWWGVFYIFGGVFAWVIAIIESIVFLATPKESWDSKYGNVNSHAGVIVGAVIGGVALIGILAAIALPAYQDYASRAKISKIVDEMEPTKRRIAQYAKKNGELPASLSDIENLPTINRQHLESVNWRGQRNLVLTFSSKLTPLLEGETLVFRAHISDEDVSWDCSGGTLASQFRPPICREGKRSSEQAKDSSKLVRSVSNRYQFRVPSNWGARTDLNADATFQYANLIKEEYLIAFEHSKVDVADYSFEDYATLLSEDFNLNNLQIQFIGESNVSGLRTLNYEVQGSSEGTDLLYKLGFIEGKEHYYYFLFWTLPSKRSSAFPNFSKTLKSFKEQ